MAENPSPLQFVVVIWDDAWKDAVNDSTVENASDCHKPVLCYTVGWLLKEDEAGVSIANEYSPDGTYRGRTFAPRGMIKDVIPVNLTRPRKKRNPE